MSCSAGAHSTVLRAAFRAVLHAAFHVRSHSAAHLFRAGVGDRCRDAEAQ
jgi:hypothetical protein